MAPDVNLNNLCQIKKCLTKTLHIKVFMIMPLRHSHLGMLWFWGSCLQGTGSLLPCLASCSWIQVSIWLDKLLHAHQQIGKPRLQINVTNLPLFLYIPYNKTDMFNKKKLKSYTTSLEWLISVEKDHKTSFQQSLSKK